MLFQSMYSRRSFKLIKYGVKLEKLAGKIANFKNTKNHCWSRYIVDVAVKNKCGVIQMEDLSLALTLFTKFVDN